MFIVVRRSYRAMMLGNVDNPPMFSTIEDRFSRSRISSSKMLRSEGRRLGLSRTDSRRSILSLGETMRIVGRGSRMKSTGGKITGPRPMVPMPRCSNMLSKPMVAIPCWRSTSDMADSKLSSTRGCISLRLPWTSFKRSSSSWRSAPPVAAAVLTWA